MWINKILEITSKTRSLVILGIGVFIINLIMLVAPFGIKAIEKQTDGNYYLDTKLFYSEETVYQYISSYGEEGINMYHQVQILDMIYPLIYGIFLASFFYRKKLLKLYFIPLLAIVFDYSENISIYFLLENFPKQLPNLVVASSLATSLKWLSITTSISILLYFDCKKICFKHTNLI
jgi:hypothetical protein